MRSHHDLPFPRARAIVDLTVTTALGLATAIAVTTGRATDAVAAVLWIAFCSLGAAVSRSR